MRNLLRLLQTTTFRLTGLFILIFVLASIGLLTFVAYQSSIIIQRSQTAAISRETSQLIQLDRVQGFRAVAVAVQILANRPGPGIYYLGDKTGRMIAGNVSDFPSTVLTEPGMHTFDYGQDEPQLLNAGREDPVSGYALVQSVVLDSGLRLLVGRDIVERRGYAAIIFQGFLVGVVGIVILSLAAGGLTAMRVLRRIDSITATSNMIMSGSMHERVPVTKRNDEFDRLATSLNAMLSRIEQLMQGLKEVTDNVAHDLKTPLTRLRNQAEAALRAGTSDETQRGALRQAIEESDQLIRTFNALLLIARAESGTATEMLEAVDLSEIVADVVELYSPVAEDAGVSLTSDVAPGISLPVHRELLSQALVNLIENAIKYSEDSQAEDRQIVVSARQEAGRVLVIVADNGPGIAAADRERVVERFVRLEQSRAEPGSGLGLSLVAAVARLHKGVFRLEDNAPGVRAVIDLPEVA